MLNRYILTVYIEYFFNHLLEFNSEDCYKFMKENTNHTLSSENDEIEKIHYNILLNNKNISLEEQYVLVKERIKEFRNYCETNDLLDNYILARLNTMENLVLPVTIDFLNRRRRVRELRQGYKKSN